MSGALFPGKRPGRNLQPGKFLLFFKRLTQPVQELPVGIRTAGCVAAADVTSTVKT